MAQGCKIEQGAWGHKLCSSTPRPIKVAAERGGFVRPLAYSKANGLYEGDPFEVRVADYRPEAVYEGRPNGPITITGKGLYQ